MVKSHIAKLNVRSLSIKDMHVYVKEYCVWLAQWLTCLHDSDRCKL